MTYDVRETPEEVISRALSCAEGEAAIDEVDERAAREWLAELIAERDAFERDYTAVGERNKELHDMYFSALALAERRAGALRRVRLWLHNNASDAVGVDAMLRTVNTALAAPPPASEDTGGAR